MLVCVIVVETKAAGKGECKAKVADLERSQDGVGFALHTHRCRPLFHSLHRILELVQPTLRSADRKSHGQLECQ